MSGDRLPSLRGDGQVVVASLSTLRPLVAAGVEWWYFTPVGLSQQVATPVVDESVGS